MVHVQRIAGSGIMISQHMKDKVRHQRRQRFSHDAMRINTNSVCMYVYFVAYTYIMCFRLTSYLEWRVYFDGFMCDVTGQLNKTLKWNK